MKNKKVKKSIYNLLFILSLSVFLYSGFRLVSYYFEYKKMDNVYANITSNVLGNYEVNINQDVLAQAPDVNMEELLAINSEVVGYVLIPNTKISYPILYSSDELKYLNYDIQNNRSRSGAIFLEPTDPDLYDNSLIIHGHNMINDTMFGQLNEYVDDETFFKDHPYIYIYTKDAVSLYRIFSADTIEDGSSTYRLAFSSDTSLMKYIYERIEESEFEPAMQPSSTHQIITLSTCSNYGETLRTIVQAYYIGQRPR